MVAFVNCAEATEAASKTNPGRHRANRRYNVGPLASCGMFRHPVYAGAGSGLPIISRILQTVRPLRMRRSNHEAHTVYGRASLLLANRLCEIWLSSTDRLRMVRCHPQIREQQGLAARLCVLPVRLDRHKHCIDLRQGLRSSRLLVNDVPLTAAHFYGSSQRRVVLGIKPAGFNCPLIDDSETELHSTPLREKGRL
jgi:hypothetical protein